MNTSNPKCIKFYIDQYESSYLLRSLIRSSGHCCNYFIVIYCRILWCWDAKIFLRSKCVRDRGKIASREYGMHNEGTDERKQCWRG